MYEKFVHQVGHWLRLTVSIVQEAGWAPGPVWTGTEKSRPHRRGGGGEGVVCTPDRPGRSESLYRLSYACRSSNA